MTNIETAKIGNSYKATFGGRYFFGKLVKIDLQSGTYVLFDLRKKYDIVAPINATMLEPYEELL
jgi:hypothetical protein